VTWDAPVERRRRTRRRALVASVILTIAWGTFAFGGVYRWAYAPLLVACPAIGLACLLPRRHGLPRATGRLALWLACLAAGVLLQLLPLPAGVLARVSPATDAFLKSYYLSYAVPAAASETAAQAWHPLSLAPASTWLALAFLCALGLLLVGLMRSLGPPHARAIVGGLIVLGVLVAVIGIAQKAMLGDDFRVRIYGFWQPLYRNSPFGPFANRNHFGGWMLMVLPLALGSFASALHHALGTIGAGWRNKVLWLGSERAGKAVMLAFACVVMAVAMVYAASRSGLACALFAVGAVAWLAVRARMARTARLVVGGAFTLLVASALVWAGSDVILHRFTLVPAEIGDRLGAWRDALHVIHDFPLAGIGLNAYGTASIQYQTVESAWQYTTAHNDYLQIAAEGGFLLGVPAALAIVALVRLMRRRWRQGDDDPTASWLRAGAFVSLATIALQSLVDFSLQIPANAVLFVVVAAIAVHRPLR